MIIKVNKENLQIAAEINAESWQNSHSTLYSESFIKRHNTARQKVYLKNSMKDGKRLYMLVKEIPVGIVSIKDNLIEDLYILPTEQHKGYGTDLLLFAIEECRGTLSDDRVPQLLVNPFQPHSLCALSAFRLSPVFDYKWVIQIWSC